MSKSKIIAFKKPGDISEDPLTELLRTGARRLIANAVEAELDDISANLPGPQRSERPPASRSQWFPSRTGEIHTGIGPVAVRIRKIRDKRGDW